MSDLLASFTPSLRRQTTLLRLREVPALLCLPEDPSPAPLFLWLHGRTVSKELDSARYLRLIRQGVAVCALDLPGHGERFDAALQRPAALPLLLERALAEVDPALEALFASPHADRLEAGRLAIGGMSAGGMVTLRRLCDPHGFRCAAVEATAGDFRAAADALGADAQDRWDTARARGLDPATRLDGWRPLPLLALHSERDALAPFAGMQSFCAKLQAHYRARGADPALVRLHSWPETGAPEEHAGFGRRAGEARKLLLEFLAGAL